MHLLLPLLALAFCLGALGARAGQLPPVELLLATLLAALAALLLLRRPLAAAGALLVTGLGVGATLGAAAWSSSRPACHVSHATSQTTVRLFATVDGAGSVTASGTRTLLRAHALQRGHGLQRACGAVELTVPAGLWLRSGEEVLVRTRLRPAVVPRNPGSAGFQLRFLSQDVGARARAESGDVAVLHPRRGGPLERLRRRVRDNITAAVERPRARALLGALVLGDRQLLDTQTRQRFARAGVSHLLAISGLHLGLVAGALLLLLRRLLLVVPVLARRTDVRRHAALVAALSTVGYTLLTGASPSTVRACVMVCACFLGLLWARAPDLWRPLSLACLVLLVGDPLNLWRPGFQLSFCAVIGIALAHQRLQRRATSGVLDSPLGWMRGLLLSTIAATLATAPVVAHHFGQVSLAGLATNAVAIPWTTFVLLPLGLCGAVAGLLSSTAGEALLGAAGWAALQLDSLCGLVAAREASVVSWCPGWPVSLGLLAALVALVSGRRVRYVALAISLSLLAASGLWFVVQRGAPALELTFLDVGQGDSTLARLPDGTTILIDGGGSLSESYDPGAARVVPYLRRRGIRRLDLVVATHPHPDHVRGLTAVLRELEVAELWTCWHLEPNPWQQQLLARARRRGVRVNPPRLLRRGRAVVRPLWPAGYDGHCADPGFSANDNSIVLRLELGRSAALLPGDIEAAAEQQLLSRNRRWLRADVLKAPHHGSASSSTEAFLRAVDPRVAVISCGLENSFGIPPPSVQQRYLRLGVPLARVDLDGAIRVTLVPDGTVRWYALTK